MLQALTGKLFRNNLVVGSHVIMYLCAAGSYFVPTNTSRNAPLITKPPSTPDRNGSTESPISTSSGFINRRVLTSGHLKQFWFSNIKFGESHSIELAYL